MVEYDPHEPFDPLAVENVGVTLAVELLEQPVNSVPPTEKFTGAGVYALYYGGSNAAYRKLVRLDDGKWKYPVYVGSAVRENASQGFSSRPAAKAQLYNRIRKHEKSIRETNNLDSADFRCRYLILKDAYISLAESVMIRVFRPAWNGMSFGSNPVGGPRMKGKSSLWDSLHPGRGGRPTGTKERAEEALNRIQECIDKLGEEVDDPSVQRMYEKIMRFV